MHTTTQEPRQLVYTSHVPVRWSDMDAFGHVNNAVYFTYFEQARIQWWEKTGLSARNIKKGPILATANCKFIRPIFHPAEINVNVYAGPGKRSSYTLHYEVIDHHNPEVVYAEGSTVIVWFDYEAGKSVELPPEFRLLLPA